jgi:hypothetical protein
VHRLAARVRRELNCTRRHMDMPPLLDNEADGREIEL